MKNDAHFIIILLGIIIFLMIFLRGAHGPKKDPEPIEDNHASVFADCKTIEVDQKSIETRMVIKDNSKPYANNSSPDRVIYYLETYLKLVCNGDQRVPYVVRYLYARDGIDDKEQPMEAKDITVNVVLNRVINYSIYGVVYFAHDLKASGSFSF